MSRPAAQPTLTPQYCFNTTALKDFLRLSRSTVDDSIVQNLNALSSPSSRGFDPSSTASRQVRPSQRSLESTACQTFKDKVLFPSWQSRSDVLKYCASVALNPEDPDAVLARAESEKEKERVVDERLDPYSGRFFPREPRTEILAGVVRNERSVEGIVRERTWGLVRERCGEDGTWEEAVERWRRGEEGGKR